MAVYKCKYRIGFTDIYKNNEINNTLILTSQDAMKSI